MGAEVVGVPFAVEVATDDDGRTAEGVGGPIFRSFEERISLVGVVGVAVEAKNIDVSQAFVSGVPLRALNGKLEA